MSSDDSAKAAVATLLKSADIRINGNRPWDIQVHNEDLYKRVLSKRSLGLGEAYMDGWWDAIALDQFFDHILRAKLDQQVKGDWRIILAGARAQFSNLQSSRRAFQVGEQHYDAGNELFTHMLDARMTYSCGYWKNAKTLDEAQEHKLELLCQKLQLKKGMKLLDIGCGWGSFMKYAAEKYGVECVGVTVSKEQAKLARDNVKNLPVKILVQDYRKITGTYDRVISVGMFEHVGYKNYGEYMRVVDRCLKPGGLFVLHTIAENETDTHVEPWVHKYIFPNGQLPSISQIGKASEGVFVMEDWQNFGPDYDKTLMAWDKNFKSSWPVIKKDYDERFYRMWDYYLLSFAGSFRSRGIELWQIVFSKERFERYDAPR